MQIQNPSLSSVSIALAHLCVLMKRASSLRRAEETSWSASTRTASSAPRPPWQLLLLAVSSFPPPTMPAPSLLDVWLSQASNESVRSCLSLPSNAHSCISAAHAPGTLLITHWVCASQVDARVAHCFPSVVCASQGDARGALCFPSVVCASQGDARGALCFPSVVCASQGDARGALCFPSVVCA
eukprot:CAMPEP_0113232068 /NCGR_PEP_ID=MMETSP0008_2-20120614/1758_1 /TAXON_ID=97485 /ORGANISM="Prymnesium parvum" /LENGTH=183 /DNA_ID=CAMNT_0000078769 /DNA_START=482 /DNA_END=1030 /DNA_ORIENTATION=+ /assembly_acc=CAM_ASM_000153